jgi:glycosyltransferase involved in cell wall biosynthesis
VRRAAARYVFARADALVALSETEARWQRETYQAVPARQEVIPNGIDESIFRFRESRLPAPGEPWRLLYVGQLRRFKRVDVLLRALSLLDRSLAVELDLAYQVDTEEAALRQDVERLGLRGVRFLGRRTPSELARLYTDAHMFVLPSTGEALPSVVSESMFVGRPVVATDVGAVREQVADFGEVVAPRDPAALAGAITRVLRDYDRYAREAPTVAERTRARYSITSMIDAHERLYERLAEGTRPERSHLEAVVDGFARLTLRARGSR